MKRVWRGVSHALLVLCLLAGQQLAFAHAATHLVSNPATQDQPLPHAKLCHECVECAQLGAALIDTTALPTAIWVPAPAHPTISASVHLPRLLRAFSSRAPPAFL